MGKYYFKKDAEMCYTISGHKQQMQDNQETEREVFEAVRSSENGFFYCNAVDSVGAKESEGCLPCGKFCPLYSPRNLKSGCCIHFRSLYECSDKSKIIKI